MADSLEDGDWIWSQEICNEEVCWNLRGALLLVYWAVPLSFCLPNCCQAQERTPKTKIYGLLPLLCCGELHQEFPYFGGFVAKHVV